MTLTAAFCRKGLLAGALMILVGGCGDESTVPLLKSERELVSAKPTASGSEIDITSVTPDTGSVGTTLDVRVRGKGFDSQSIVEFALDGVPDPTQVRTNSTRYVSASELVANISISSTATVTTWDVVVTSKGKTGIGTESDVFEVLDATITWFVPMGDASLAIQSDGRFQQDGHSVYANRVCKVETAIYVGHSGDATISTTKPKGTSCGRTFTFKYPDGVSETLAVFANAVFLHNETSAIPVGQTVRRKFNWNPGVLSGQSSARCGRLVYGQKDAVAVGSDSVEVTRVNSNTWNVQSGGNHIGWCEKTGALYRMPFRLTLVSDIPLP